MTNKRVVVTGLGAITPLGHSIFSTWDALLKGCSGVHKVTLFDPSDYACQIGAEVKDFNTGNLPFAKELRRLDRYAQFAAVASAQALDDAGLTVSSEVAERTGVIIGSGMGGLATVCETQATINIKGPRRVSPFSIPGAISNMAAGIVSILFGLQGPSYATVSACATGAHAIGDGYYAILRGDADVMLVGGSEATIHPVAYAGFSSAKAMSVRNHEPQQASRPFDLGRDGFVMGEGAGILVLEELEHAQKRGARIYAELIGFGMSSDAYHMTAPSPEGEGAARCMTAALRSAGIAPEQLGYINAHGTSTELGDIAETIAVKKSFGSHAYRLAISSTKSMTGHLLGASGAVEAMFTLLAICRGILPPTINLDQPDPMCDLDYVPNRAREAKVDVALSNSFGFGGANTTVIFRRWE